jgi:hypothetical protein
MPIAEAIAMIFVTIAVFVGVTAIIDTILSHRRDMAKIKYGRSEREAALLEDKVELKETVAMLQDRLAVLETIATDPARRTAEEIERLR